MSAIFLILNPATTIVNQNVTHRLFTHRLQTLDDWSRCRRSISEHVLVVPSAELGRNKELTRRKLHIGVGCTARTIVGLSVELGTFRW
jgi:hypothetical protein